MRRSCPGRTGCDAQRLLEQGGALLAADGHEYARFRERRFSLGAAATSVDAFVLVYEAARVARLAHGGIGWSSTT